MTHRNTINTQRARRTGRTRAKIFGTKQAPRLAVFRSNRAISAQLIDDEAGKTLAAVSAKEVAVKGTKTDAAARAGELIAAKALKLGITKVVFDRRSYQYHGRVRALAESARKGGLKF